MENNSDLSARLPDLLADALERPPPDRAAFLAAACPDNAALRAEVLSLAGEQTGAGQFLEHPACKVSGADGDNPETGELNPGDILGDCTILGLIGEGGMGEVYLAQDHRLGRRVAVKLLKRHLHETLGPRFRQEQRVLAGLTHPGIARLYSAAMSDGRAYLVMEYVEGERLDEYCDKRRLSIDARLAIFRKVCAAVSHAHQNLVVHRDLKPANIRVTPEGEPKLLDFGIAKLIDPQSGHDTEQTVTLYTALTPGYASPEQLRGDAVTTATDTFSLGVILYELLCGRRPFDPQTRRTGDPARAAREEAVPRPGGVLPTPGAAETRATTPARLSRQLAGDLDNVVLMAMRFDPARRYPSVSQLAEDLRRHLDGQPVSARKETLRYVGAKFIARNKAAAAAAGLVLLTLLGGIAATARQAHVADEQRRKADRRFDDVQRLAHSLMFEIHDSVQDLAGSTATRRLIVDRALEYLDRLRQDADTPALRLETAAAYEKIGDVQGNPYYANLGDTAGAEASYRKAEALLQSSPGNAPTVEVRMALGRIERALGDIFDLKGNFPDEVRAYRQSLGVFERLARERSSDPAALDELARAYETLSEGLERTAPGSAEQVRCSEQSLAWRQKLTSQVPGNVKYRRGMAIAYMKLGQLTVQDKAHGVNDLARGVAELKALAAENPDNARARREYAWGLFTLGWAQGETGDRENSLRNREESLTIRERIAAADPKDSQAQYDLAASHGNVAEALIALGQPEKALDHSRQAVTGIEGLMAADPGNNMYVRNDAIFYKKLGEARAALAARETLDASARLTYWTDAQTAYEKARQMFSDLGARGVVRTEDSDMLDKLAAGIAKCQEEAARLRK